MFKILTAVLVNFLAFQQVFGDCPSAEIFAPCICNKPDQREKYGIECGGNTAYDLEKVFKSISDRIEPKDFDSFYLTNTAITELKDNTFKDITFNSIHIVGATKLTKISKDAFAGTNKFTTDLQITNNPSLSSTDVFESINQFTKLERIWLIQNNISEIPDHAFKRHDSLYDLELSGKSIKKIGSNAFSQLTSMGYLRLWNTSIESIPDYAFAMNGKRHVEISLKNDGHINSTSFSAKAFDGIKQEALLYLGTKLPINFLQEKVFLSFFKQNEKNKLYAELAKFDCNDCNNVWLKNNPALLARTKYLLCSNSKSITDSDNFKNC